MREAPQAMTAVEQHAFASGIVHMVPPLAMGIVHVQEALAIAYVHVLEATAIRDGDQSEMVWGDRTYPPCVQEKGRD